MYDYDQIADNNVMVEKLTLAHSSDVDVPSHHGQATCWPAIKESKEATRYQTEARKVCSQTLNSPIFVLLLEVT